MKYFKLTEPAYINDRLLMAGDIVEFDESGDTKPGKTWIETDANGVPKKKEDERAATQVARPSGMRVAMDQAPLRRDVDQPLTNNLNQGRARVGGPADTPYGARPIDPDMISADPATRAAVEATGSVSVQDEKVRDALDKQASKRAKAASTAERG